jgi:hypothetical protein
MRCQEKGRKSCLVDLRLSDDTPSVVELFTQLTVALRKKFPNAQLTDVIAANLPYLGGGIHSGVNAHHDREEESQKTGIADKTDAAQTMIDQAPAPASSAAGGASIQPAEQDRLYWVDVVKQAEAGGNVTQYLSDKDIPKSTYYAKKKLYRL